MRFIQLETRNKNKSLHVFRKKQLNAGADSVQGSQQQKRLLFFRAAVKFGVIGLTWLMVMVLLSYATRRSILHWCCS